MFLGGGGDILDEFRRMERAMTRALEPPGRAGRGPLARTQTTRANNGDSRRSQSEVRFSSSSYAYSYRGPGGPDGAPAHFEYTAQSRGVAGPRVETVTETKRSYKDSTGRERHGVSRTVGDRGRRVTRERDGVSGEERCEDRLLATEDGDAFDRDWAAAAAVHRVPLVPPHPRAPRRGRARQSRVLKGRRGLPPEVDVRRAGRGGGRRGGRPDASEGGEDVRGADHR